MLNESLLWAKAIDPLDGRVVKEETFLGAALAISVLALALIVLVVVFL